MPMLRWKRKSERLAKEVRCNSEFESNNYRRPQVVYLDEYLHQHHCLCNQCCVSRGRTRRHCGTDPLSPHGGCCIKKTIEPWNLRLRVCRCMIFRLSIKGVLVSKDRLINIRVSVSTYKCGRICVKAAQSRSSTYIKVLCAIKLILEIGRPHTCTLL